MAKVKHKRHKGLAKRVRVTAKRKVKRKASFTGHLMSGMRGKRRQRLNKMIVMAKSDTKRTLDALGL